MKKADIRARSDAEIKAWFSRRREAERSGDRQAKIRADLSLHIGELESFGKSAEGDAASNLMLMLVNNARALTELNIKSFVSTVEKLPISEKEKSSVYHSLSCILSTISIACWSDSTLQGFEDARAAAAREKLPAYIASRQRREALRPFVEQLAEKLNHFPRPKRLAAVEWIVMRSDATRTVIPKKLNPRQIRADITAIMFPEVEGCDESWD